MEEIEKPNYYAIIPANVRYDERLSDKEKLLYGEITSLSNKEGYCWASNSYFASLYKASIKTISRGINNLRECGYFDIELQYRKNSKEVEKRIIKLKSYPMDKNVYTYGQNHPYPMDKNVQDNNTSINTIKEYNIRKKFTPPTLEEVEQYIAERKSSVNAKEFYDFYAVNDWKDSNDKPVKNWKQKLITWDKRNKKSSCRDSSCQCEYSLEQDWDKEAFEGVYEYGD